MAARHKCFTVLSALIVVLVGWFAVANAGQYPTASELLSTGVKQLEQGEAEKALTTLLRVDPAQLDAAQQQQLQTAIANAKAGKTGPVPAPKGTKPVVKEEPKPEPAPAPVEEPKTEEPKPEPAPTPAPVEEPKTEPAPAPVEEPKQEPKPEPAPSAPVAAEQPSKAAPADAKVMAQARTLEAQRLTAQGDQHAAQGLYDLALEDYSKALAIDPSNQLAQAGQAKVEGLSGRSNNPKLLREYEAKYNIMHGQAVARFTKAMDHANQSAEAQNYTEAQDALALAKAILDQNRQWLSEAEYAQMRTQVLDRTKEIDTVAEAKRIDEISKKEMEAKQEQTTRRQLAAEERERKIQQLLRRAADLRKELNYEQALEVIDQLLFLDPNNIAGSAMKEMIEDAIVFRNHREIYNVRSRKIAEQSNEAMAATIPHTELITYPPDWPQLSANRLKALQSSGGDSEADRRVRDKLKQAIPINFEGNRLENVIEYLRNVTGVNIVVNWRALEGAGIEPGTTVTLQLTSVPADKALELILDQVGGDLVPLGYAIDKGVVTISTIENLGKITNIRTYDIRDLVVQAPNFAEAPDFDLVEVTRSPASSGGGGGGGQQQLFQEGDDELAASRTELIEQIMTLIRDTVDPDNWRNAGGLVSSMSELNGTLIVNTTGENHRKILGLLSQLRETRALQINVEARFLLVDQNYLDELGFDMDITWDPGGDFSPITFSQESEVMGDRQNTAIPGSFGSSGQAGTPDDGRFSRGMTISGGIIGDVSVDLLIRATQANRRATSLSAPRITFFNGQRGYVLIATQLSYISDLDPAVGTDAALFDPEIGVVSSGVVLDVEGTVSADRRYVTITARPSLARVVRLRTISVFGAVANADNGADADADAADADADIDADNGDVSGFGIIEAPELELTTVRTTVSVPDKGTLLLGGQRLVADIEIEAGVPVLNKLPILNRLFTNRSTVKDERTLLVLIKPTVLIQTEKEDELFPGMIPEFGGEE